MACLEANTDATQTPPEMVGFGLPVAITVYHTLFSRQEHLAT
jgi:hypothetical protein